MVRSFTHTGNTLSIQKLWKKYFIKVSVGVTSLKSRMKTLNFNYRLSNKN
jgi:hypothetical protein